MNHGESIPNPGLGMNLITEEGPLPKSGKTRAKKDNNSMMQSQSKD